jgi:ABC-type nitrate/sulfonate/bicarbonate transport system substrate-binding protein
VDYSKYDITPVVLGANRSAVENKREAVVAFLRGWLAAVDIFNNDPDKAAAIVKAHFTQQGFEISDKVVKLMLSKLDVRTDYIPELNAALTAEAETLVKGGQLSEVPDFSKLLDSSLLEEARKA